MQEQLKEKFPKWCEDTTTKFDLILSDDIDSYMCYIFQKRNLSRELNYFVDWNKHYIDNQGNKVPCQGFYRVEKTGNKAIGLDMALEGNKKCWDNHVVRLSSEDNYNSNTANINSIMGISNNNYYDKACLSTFITMLSYYGIDISNWSDEQKLILCCIDGLYYPWKVKYKDFRPVQRKYLKLLEYEYLEEFMTFYINKSGYSEFYKCIDTYNLNSKIYVNEKSKLQTDIKLQDLGNAFDTDLSLPEFEFSKYMKFDKYSIDLKTKYITKKDQLDGEGLFNFAITNKSYAIYSTKNSISI